MYNICKDKAIVIRQFFLGRLRRTIIGKFVYIKNNKTKAHQLGHWKEAKRIEVVTLFLSIGSMTEVAKITGVPYPTIEGWRRQDWWKELVEKMQAEDDQKLDAKTTKLIDKALEQLMDRIENGEHIYDQKTGKVKRMPAKLRDLNTAFNTILDKRQLLRNKPTKIVEQHSTAAQLQNLAESFAKFVQKKTEELPERHYIEGDTVVQNEDGTYELKE